jgi:hypothetical protein
VAQTIEAYGFKLTLEDIGLSDEAVSEIEDNAAAWYLVVNGFRQSIGDAGAVDAKTWEALRTREKNPILLTRDQYIEERRQARYDTILSGEVELGGSSGPRAKGLDKYINEAAETWLRAEYTRQKKTYPSGKGAAKAIKAKITEILAHPKLGDKIRATAKVNMETAAQAEDSESIIL